jgi:hypothetical protein
VFDQASVNINLADFLQRNIWNFVLETTMYINTIVRSPTAMAESLN